jgi:hypothetical protein
LQAGTIFAISSNLVAITVPLVSTPPGNSTELQAHAGFFLHDEKPSGFLSLWLGAAPV